MDGEWEVDWAAYYGVGEHADAWDVARLDGAVELVGVEGVRGVVGKRDADPLVAYEGRYGERDH